MKYESCCPWNIPTEKVNNEKDLGKKSGAD